MGNMRLLRQIALLQSYLFLSLTGCNTRAITDEQAKALKATRLETKEQLPELVGKRVVFAGSVPNEPHPKNHVWVSCDGFAVDLKESAASYAFSGRSVTVVGRLCVKPPAEHPNDPSWAEIGEQPNLVPLYYLEEWSEVR
jgi:hypothetical protein